MEKFSLATIFIRGLNDCNLLLYFKYQLNYKILTCKKMILRFGCFCSKATVLGHSLVRSLVRSHGSLRSLPRSWENEFLMSQNDLVSSHSTLWARKIEKPDCSTGPLARPFACSLAPLTHWACSALSVLLARSAALTRSLAGSLRSLPRSWDSDWLDGYLFCFFFYSGP